ncbi:MAG: hypothetical protein HY403_11040 [Elusimicrobia bacterium]|nr:hypothetical protein [Elusimicrobiota bacterium]
MKKLFWALFLASISRSAFALTEVKLRCEAGSSGFPSIQLEREYDETAKKVSWFVSYKDTVGRSERARTQPNGSSTSVKYPLPPISSAFKTALVVGYGSEPPVAILMYGLDARGKADVNVDFLKGCEHHVLSPLPGQRPQAP